MEALIDEVLQGEWGQGRWLDILVAACVYIVIRQKRLALTIADVAVSCQSGPLVMLFVCRVQGNCTCLQMPSIGPNDAGHVYDCLTSKKHYMNEVE